MITRRVLLLTLAILPACHEDAIPIEPVWGKQPCEHCKMILSQRASAAQVLARSGRYFFDDIGCMVQWLEEQHLEGRTWVHLGEGWVDAESAHYVGGASTPMDHGYLASNTGTIGWTELRKRVLEKERPQ